MTPEQIELERQAFEAWYRTTGTAPLEREGDGYAYMHLDYAWQAWQARAQAWISVEERLPELNKEVLVAWSNSSVGIARHIKDEFEPTEWDTYGSHVNITHWQPLPEPPKAA